MAITPLSQQDSRWGNKYLGKTKYTIARYGCVTVDLTMIYNYIFGRQKTPDNVAQILEYTSGGLLIWKSLQKLNLSLKERFYGKQSDTINAGLKNPKTFVILQVNSNHWVWLIGRYIPYFGYKIIDPWDGRTKHTNAYRNNITGGAVITI